MNSKYRSCFNCNMRPATIKCLTCKVLKSNESIQKLCYICDKNIHQQNSNHNKDLIPFNGIFKKKKLNINKKLEMKTEIRRINSTIRIY